MRTSQFSDEQMVRAVRETDHAAVADVAKRHGVSVATVYAWKKRFGTMSTDDAKRLRLLESENGKLKRMLAEKLLELDVLREIQTKKW
jgi:putative transposase